LISIPEEKVYRYPESLSFVQASMIEPYSLASETISRGEPVAGEKALVFGAGTIGLGILQGLKLRGLDVMITDFIDNRLTKASELGAYIIVNGKKENLREAVKAFTGGFGIDFVVDAVGNTRIVEQAIEMTAPGGRIAVLGFNTDSAQIPEVLVSRKELKIVGVRMNCKRFPEVIEWFRKKEVHPDKLLSALYPFEEIQKAFEHIAAESENTLKIIVTL
jgi:L-gulonate 5-dehydrogenase